MIDNDFIKLASSKLSYQDTLELYSYIKEIIESDFWKEKMNFQHHENETLAYHSIKVCILSYKLGKKLQFKNIDKLVIGALTHDLFGYCWHEQKKPNKLKEYHAFAHPHIAWENFEEYFSHLSDPIIKDIITKHMWPITIKPPKTKEAWLVCYCDKHTSLFMLKSFTSILKLLGLKKLLKFKN